MNAAMGCVLVQCVVRPAAVVRRFLPRTTPYTYASVLIHL